MKIIIAGSRTITNRKTLDKAMVMSGFDKKITEVVSGGAKGVDSLGEAWAKEHGVPLKIFPANWDKYGKGAGHVRNKEMAEYVGDKGGLLALWDGSSPGTANMIFLARGVGMAGKIYKITRGGK